MTHDDRATWIAEALARYETPLIKFATKLLRDGDRARDIVQETFLQLCKQDRAVVSDHLAAWLFRVCRNRAYDVRRKDSHVEMMSELAVVDPRVDPSAAAERREDATQIMKIVETLPDSQQEAVYLRFQGGLSYKEIAEVTGRTVSNVGVLLHAAVKAIREELERRAAPMVRTAEVSR